MRFEIYLSKDNEYRWRLIARNGRIIADSGEGYTRFHDCVRAVTRVVTACMQVGSARLDVNIEKAKNTLQRAKRTAASDADEIGVSLMDVVGAVTRGAKSRRS